MSDLPLITAEEARERIAAIRERLAQSSSGPCRLGMCDPDLDPVELFRENVSHGSGNVWAVGLPDHPLTVGGWDERPAHMVFTCITGNGPTSKNNAVFYAHARADIEALLSLLEKAEADRDRLRAILASLVSDCSDTPMVDAHSWQQANAYLADEAADLAAGEVRGG